MRILVACEESQIVTAAFRKLGHEAYSCDIEPCSGGFTDWHIQQDVISLLNEKWDMIIAFPPCTYLSNAGAVRLYPQGKLNKDRYLKGLKAKEFFLQIYNSACPRIAIENPIYSKIFKLPKHSQIIEPYYFGEAYKKKTCLWLKGLPNLEPTDIITSHVVSWVDLSRNPKIRSKTFLGVANAMSEQWGSDFDVRPGYQTSLFY